MRRRRKKRVKRPLSELKLSQVDYSAVATLIAAGVRLQTRMFLRPGIHTAAELGKAPKERRIVAPTWAALLANRGISPNDIRRARTDMQHREALTTVAVLRRSEWGAT